MQECVLLLHGLTRTATAMQALAIALQTDYHVINIDYPSREKSIEILAMEVIAGALAQCPANSKKIHFVTHSMGGILLRYYLKKTNIEKLGRVVMLAPPNHGSEVVDKLKNVWGFALINGLAGQQLGTDKNSIPAQLGRADFDLGIITGTASINPWLSYLIKGENDGKVSVESAKLAGMNDFLTVASNHTFIMKNKHVIQHVLYYLQHGCFIPSKPD